MWGYLPVIRNDSVTHMNDRAVYLKEGNLFAHDLSLENFEDCFFLRFQLALLQSVPYLFSALVTVPFLLHSFWRYYIQHKRVPLNQLFC